MKKYLKTYRSFCPDIYTLIMLLLVPTALFFLNMALIPAHNEYTLGFSVLWLMFVDVYGDYFTYNDVFSKGYNFGILKCSLKARGVLKNGVITDQVRRFFQIALVIGINSAWILHRCSPDTERFILMILTMIFFTYAADTAAILIVRKITQYSIYFLVGGFTVGILGTVELLLVMLAGYLLGVIDLKILLFLAILLSFVLTRQILKTIEKNYDQSFKEVA